MGSSWAPLATALRLWIVFQHEYWSVLFISHSRINGWDVLLLHFLQQLHQAPQELIARAGTVDEPGLSSALQCSVLLLVPIRPLSGIAGAEKGMQ